jgi:flagellar hook-length control protein FliK
MTAPVAPVMLNIPDPGLSGTAKTSSDAGAGSAFEAMMAAVSGTTTAILAAPQDATQENSSPQANTSSPANVATASVAAPQNNAPLPQTDSTPAQTDAPAPELPAGNAIPVQILAQIENAFPPIAGLPVSEPTVAHSEMVRPAPLDVPATDENPASSTAVVAVGPKAAAAATSPPAPATNTQQVPANDDIGNPVIAIAPDIAPVNSDATPVDEPEDESRDTIAANAMAPAPQPSSGRQTPAPVQRAKSQDTDAKDKAPSQLPAQLPLDPIARAAPAPPPIVAVSNAEAQPASPAPQSEHADAIARMDDAPTGNASLPPAVVPETNPNKNMVENTGDLVGKPAIANSSDKAASSDNAPSSGKVPPPSFAAEHAAASETPSPSSVSSSAPEPPASPASHRSADASTSRAPGATPPPPTDMPAPPPAAAPSIPADVSVPPPVGVAWTAPTYDTDTPVQLAFSNAAGVPDSHEMDSLALRIAAKSADGASQFQIRLDPPELGRIEVSLNMDSHGNAQANLSADRPQTLELLQRDAPQLERALKDAGLDLAGGLSFSLKGDGRSGAWRDAQGAPRSPYIEIAAVDAASSNTLVIGTTLAGYGQGSGYARLDIRV